MMRAVQFPYMVRWCVNECFTDVHPLTPTYITAVVDKPCQISRLGRIDDGIFIHTEQITTANAHSLVHLFPVIRYPLSNHLADILDDHLVDFDTLASKQPPVVNVGLGKADVFLAHF